MNKLRELRVSRGMNMRQVAAALDMPYTTYVNYEKGVRELNSETLVIFAEFYNVSVDYLIGRISENENAPINNDKRTISDDDIQFALFGGRDEITDAMYDEVKKFAAYLKQRENYNK